MAVGDRHPARRQTSTCRRSEFFEKIADDDPHFAGSKVILCTGTPSWTEEIRKRRKSRPPWKKETAYANLGFFEKHVIVKRGASRC